MKTPDKVTIPRFAKMKREGKPIACLTAYDWTLARLLDEAGIDLILVGDSASMVFAGHDNTLPITMDQMVYHTQVVSRAVKRALVVADMPFLSFQVSAEEALRNGGRLLKEGGAEAVKLEGGEQAAETVRRMTGVGIPVMGHLGLTPQSIRALGGYQLQGKGEKEAEAMKKDAKILEEAGAFAIVLEKIPASLAQSITSSISIPTIGIGAGPHCDGQVLVTHDLLGLYEEFTPKFVRRYAELGRTIREAVSRYADDVRAADFPGPQESF